MSDLERLRELGRPENGPKNELDPSPAARAAFRTAFQPWPVRATAAVVPVALASVVGVYLMWALGAAFGAH